MQKAKKSGQTLADSYESAKSLKMTRFRGYYGKT
jgi:hypothetical protein